MSDYYNAFEASPVPAPGPDAVAPELFRGIYGMPAFVTIPTSDLAASVDFWTRGLEFFELFSIPGSLVHLRRWAFQDVLLVPAASVSEQTPGMSVGFSCVLNQSIPLSGRAVRCARTRSTVHGIPLGTPARWRWSHPRTHGSS